DESCPDLETFVARKRLRELIALLPEREREVIRQYYFEDRTMREIADNFSLKSTASISRNHTRALERLAAAIGGE
ncbi:MAG TPA: sigma-70 family RNA polymerase sigma factor, partial [Oligoflexia bacterium]|nr:sigma-70 family RNA polymerase sigma factor [Oligoflexia bacterium]